MHRAAQIIHICGWAGCGKRTIALELSRIINGKVIDNHLILNPAGALFERGTTDHSSLRSAVRAAVFEHALRLPPDIPLILTDALADQPSDLELFEPVKALALARVAQLCLVTLDIAEAENIKRLISPGRAELGKLTEPDILIGLRAQYDLLRPKGAVSIDVTHLRSEERRVGKECRSRWSPYH